MVFRLNFQNIFYYSFNAFSVCIFYFNPDRVAVHCFIKIVRPNQQIYFNGSTTLNAADLQWQVPLAPVPAIR